MAHYNQPYSSPRLPQQAQQFPSSSRTPTPQMATQQSSSSINNTAPARERPADYVYFDRTTAGFSDEAIPKAKAAQLKLEHFYKVAVDSAIERNQRYITLHSMCIHRVLNCHWEDVSNSSEGCRRITRSPRSASNGSCSSSERKSRLFSD